MSVCGLVFSLIAMVENNLTDYVRELSLTTEVEGNYTPGYGYEEMMRKFGHMSSRFVLEQLGRNVEDFIIQ